MDVFISWSGKSSKILAQALVKYFPMIIQGIDAFVSNEINKGTVWNAEIGSKLKTTSCGIICLTPDNLNQPWLLFEAGAISVNADNEDGKDAHVATLLLNMQTSDIDFPLAQFQATLCTEQDILKLLIDINKLTSKPISENALTHLFGKFWPDIEKEINEAITHIGDNTDVQEKRSQDDMLDELVKGGRLNQRAINVIIDLLSKIDSNTSTKRNSLRSLMNTPHKTTLQDLIGNSSESSTDVSGGTNEKSLQGYGLVEPTDKEN